MREGGTRRVRSFAPLTTKSPMIRTPQTCAAFGSLHRILSLSLCFSSFIRKHTHLLCVTD
jgi:hypothetical protein